MLVLVTWLKFAVSRSRLRCSFAAVGTTRLHSRDAMLSRWRALFRLCSWHLPSEVLPAQKAVSACSHLRPQQKQLGVIERPELGEGEEAVGSSIARAFVFGRSRSRTEDRSTPPAASRYCAGLEDAGGQPDGGLEPSTRTDLARSASVRRGTSSYRA